MGYENVKEKFEAMGARAVVSVGTVTSDARRVNYTVDVNDDRSQGETFEVLVAPESADDVEITVPCINKTARHLLLAVRNGRNYAQFLCGHDERHWFVAALPRNVGNVRQAIEALKPAEATESQAACAVRRKNRNKRRNAGFIRQGEWFFIPAPKLDSRDDLIVYKDEPLRRGQGKPHMTEFLCRFGGADIFVSHRFPQGLSKNDYLAYCWEHPEAKDTFTQGRIDAAVYVKGRIRHPDHKTVVLNGWHRVFANTEASVSWRQEMRFID